ncbi:hypothetical protein HPB51_025453 [Rhipicephalus microplus]|uniref:Uncharacterized protein n=1 Tax=Rhipicephalus microplus TaxID=6941 RepID=A0A9J6EJM7_RHIMP|nr:hypothetical protein HPB51_025453 [Rhipicephalus microplus]
MSIMSYNGGVVVAMKGKECVTIADDRRLGARGHSIALDFERIFEMGPKLYCGLPGLATGHAVGGTEAQVPHKPPIVAGLDPVTNEPNICVMNLIGCIDEPTHFVISGTCKE